MNRLLPLCLLCSIPFFARSQTYSTSKSGNSNASSTWTANQKPPTTGTCNCTIIINTGHTVTYNETVNMANAKFVLKGSGRLTFQGNNPMTLTASGGNTSSFDLQSDQATIFYNANTDPFIRLGGTIIFRGNTTRFPASEPLGTVRGPASAISSNPVWSNSTLPVILSDFNVIAKDGKINLSWSTTTEVNSSHFEIERSSDGRSWSKIASVTAAGNTGVLQHYSFNDHSALNGNNYYRLKIVDLDDAYEYSMIKTVTVAVEGTVVTTGPNPAYSILNVTVIQPAANDFQVKLINHSGQVVYNKKYSGSFNKIAVDVSKLPVGNYFVEVMNGSGSKTMKNILVLRK